MTVWEKLTVPEGFCHISSPSSGMAQKISVKNFYDRYVLGRSTTNQQYLKICLQERTDLTQLHKWHKATTCHCFSIGFERHGYTFVILLGNNCQSSLKYFILFFLNNEITLQKHLEIQNFTQSQIAEIFSLFENMKSHNQN